MATWGPLVIVTRTVSENADYRSFFEPLRQNVSLLYRNRDDVMTVHSALRRAHS
jgi:hypothetical protein